MSAPDGGPRSLPAQGVASDRATQGTQGQQNAINGTGQGAQSAYSQQQQQPLSSYRPYPMPGVGTSTALQHMANSPYASYAIPAAPYAQLPPPPPPPPASSSSSSAAAATPAQQLRYSVPYPDPLNLLPLPSHQYAPIGMNYVPYPPPPSPAPVIASQPPLATTMPLPVSGPASTQPPLAGHVYSQLPPPPPRRRPSAADDPEALLPLPPSAFTGRSASMTSVADSAQGRLNGAQQDEDEDMPLRLPTPPSDFIGGSDDDGDYQPEAGPSGSRKKRPGSAAHDSLPVKRARVSVTAAGAAKQGRGKGKKKQPPAAQKKRGPNKTKPRLLKGEVPPPGLETTVDGSWRRKMSRGGWGGAGGRPETFLRKLWKLMQDPATDVSAYMHWDASGKLLIIPDEQALVENVCKVHFAQKSITSFNKQMNNWDFKRHARSQRDLAIISQTEPNVTRNTRIWYHPSLVATSTLEDVQNVVRHEDGMAKKRRIKSKHTGVLEEGVGTGRGKRAKVIPPTMAGEFSTLSPGPSSSEAAPSESGSQSETETKVHPTRSRASAAASGSGAKRKRPKYADTDSDDVSDTTRDGEFPSDDDDDDDDEDAEGETDEDAAASPSANEKKKKAAGGGGTSDEDAEGEPDEDLYAKQPAPAAVDVKGKGKGKGKAKAVSSEPLSPAAGKGKGRLAASSASRPRKSTTTASVPPSRQPAKKGAIKQQQRVEDSQAGGPTEAEKEKDDDNMSSRRPRRSSALAAMSAQRKQLTYDSSEDDASPPPQKKAPIENKAIAEEKATEEKKEPVAPPAKPTRAARRRSSIVVEEEEAGEAAPPTAGPSNTNTKQVPTPRGKRAVNKPVEEQQKDTPPAATRRTRASRGGAAQAEPEQEAPAVTVVETEPKAAPTPTRRSARASGIRAAKEAEADEVVARSEPASAPAPAAAEGGPSTGTRRASRGGRASLTATDAAPDSLAKADAAPASATTSRRGRGAKSGTNRGRGGATAAPSSTRGRGAAASSSRGMRRGGAGFRGGVQPLDGATDEQGDASASTSAARQGAANASRTPHVYSLPRPPHLDNKSGGTADSSREASVDASAEAGPSNGVAHSPSAASSRYLYPDATNPYGSSPYPAYPHQAQTPVMQHQHPTRPHKVYHSEPGLARTAFYYHGVSPLPRPYIHPEHNLPDEVLENGDEASVFGGDFAAAAADPSSSSSFGMAARSAGAHALAAYRNGSPVARGATVERSLSAGQYGPVSGLPPRKPTTQSQVSGVRGSLEADEGSLPSAGLAAAQRSSGEAPAAVQRHVYTVPSAAPGGETA